MMYLICQHCGTRIYGDDMAEAGNVLLDHIGKGYLDHRNYAVWCKDCLAQHAEYSDHDIYLIKGRKEVK